MMEEKLSEYNRKRRFSNTEEPNGQADISGEKLRFVVQHHMARKDHYDFRLEWNGVLLSWAVPKGPSFNPKIKRLALKVEDHPLEYRNFEGTIPQGEYGGGTVMLWDEGIWEPLSDADKGLENGSLKFVLNGKRLKGKWALVRMKTDDKADTWLLIKEKDEFANDHNDLSESSKSIRTGRTMAEIETGQEEKIIKNPFEKAEVQLAKLASVPPEGEEWLYELKYDGYRIIAYIEGNTARLMTRNNNEYTKKFSAVAVSLLDWAGRHAMVLDGEMVVTDSSGKTDFQALQNYMKNPKVQNLAYIIFDLLALDGEDLRGQPLVKRKEKLEDLMKNAPGSLHFSRHVRGNGSENFRVANELGMEGVVAKKAESIYSGTRNGDWIKIKCAKRQEFVIGGYTLSDKKTSGVSSLLLGVYSGNELCFAGRAGTGFSESAAKELEAKFNSLKRPESPFKNAPKPKANETITWLEPKLVAEIKFAEWTEENLLRQASFKGLRTDKDPAEVKAEREEDDTGSESPQETEKTMETSDNNLMIGGIKITSPDKVMFDDPQITKEEVIRYYEQVSKRMLPYVSHRILSIVRCPNGISKSCFFKKHPGADSKGVTVIPVQNDDGKTEEYFYIQDESGILYEAQMDTLEFHIWGSRVDNLEKPDMMVFDLDPDEGMALSAVCQGVRDTRDILAELSLKSYLKTSGGKGYHVVVPLKPTVSWDAFHDFAQRVAEVMEKKWPDRYTSNVKKSKRTNKIFIDWIRNGRGATSVAPYSVRARKGAKVSMPISWEELDAVAPNGIDMKEALRRIGGSDPWSDFHENNQSLK